MGLPENGASPATERLDAGALLDNILASGRVPDPADSHELPAHLERARRRAVERHPAANASTATNAPPPPKRRRPADSAVVIVIVIVAVLALGGGILLGLEGHKLGAALTSWAGRLL